MRNSTRIFSFVFFLLSLSLFLSVNISVAADGSISISSISTDNQSSSYPVANAIDDNSSTIWHTDTVVTSPHPHYLKLDLGASYSIGSFHYLPRQDGSTGGVITGYELYVSADGATWGTAVAKGTLASNNTEKEISFSAKTGRYVKFVSLSNIKGNGSAGVAEVEVFEAEISSTPPPVAADGSISISSISTDNQSSSYPVANAIDNNSSTFWHTDTVVTSPHPHYLLLDLGASYSVGSFHYLPRQDGSTGGVITGYELYVSTDGTTWGTAVAKGTLASNNTEKEITFGAKTGRYVKFVSLSNIKGNSSAGAAEVEVFEAETSSTPPPVAADGSISVSSVTTDNQSSLYPVANAIDNNSSTFWHTDTVATSPHPHYLLLDLGASYSVGSFHYLPRQDGSTGGVITGYELYVSADGATWGTAVARGTLASNNTEKEIIFSAKTGRYVKFVSLSNIKGNGSAGAAEVEVFETETDNNNGPDISVGLWNYTRDSLNETPFKVEANKKYNIKDSNGNFIAAVDTGSVTTRVSYVSDKNFKIYNSIPETLSNREVVFEAADGDSSDMVFDIYRPDSTYDQYRGKIKIKYTDSNNIWVINILPMELYVWGMGETTGTGPIEHTKLMTMTFRTYGFWYSAYATKYLPYGFRIRSDSGSQIYRGYDWEIAHPNIKLAAQSTKGKIVTYRSEIALTPYNSWTDGRTRSFEERWGSTNYPWCKSVPDPYGKHPTMTTAQLEAAGNHMVGVSANGSLKLAGSSYNWDYQRILKYYYTGIDITDEY